MKLAIFIAVSNSVQFHLEEGGDLIWIVPPALEQESLPFFSCETFVVSRLLLFMF